MPAPGTEVEIELDPTFKTTITNKDGGEGTEIDSDAGDHGGGAVTAEDILALKEELEAAKAERDAAKNRESTANARVSQTEQQARENATRLATEVNTRLEEQSAAIESGIVSTQGEIDALRNAAAKALEEGRWGDAAQANEDLADAKLRLREFSYQKGEIARHREAEKTRPKAPQLHPKTQAWIDSHQRFVSDPIYRQQALLGDAKARAAGLTPDSDKYFEMVEMETGDRKPETNNNEPPPKKESSPSASVAPVSRRSGGSDGGNGGGRQTIKLSSEQVDAADSMFGDPSSPMYIKDPKERYTYWFKQTERLKSEGRL